VAGASPARAIAIDDHATFAGIGALGRAVHEGVDEKERVPGLEPNLDRALRQRKMPLMKRYWLRTMPAWPPE
jgi:hypothetical protein